MSKTDTIAIIGAGNGGQAMAGHLALKGFRIVLYNRTPDRLKPVDIQGGVTLEGEIEGFGAIDMVTTDIGEAVSRASVIMVVTTADGHADIARGCAPYLRDGQTIILNPGRTGGALELRKVLEEQRSDVRVYVAEAQSLIYACRITNPAVVRIIGIKDYVPISAFPASDTPEVMKIARNLFDSFAPTKNVLEVSLENIGAMFHPPVVLLNTGVIERGESFLFYHSMTPRISKFIEQLDAERIRIGKAYGFELMSAADWIVTAYDGMQGDTLYSRIRNNPAYNNITAPTSIETRLIIEDILTGLVPLIYLAETAGIKVPLMRSLVEISSALINRDFWCDGRTLDKLGLNGMSVEEILEFVNS